MDYSQKFMDRFRDLESLIKQNCGYDQRDGGVVAQYVRKGKMPTKMRNEIDQCREVRNYIEHTSKINGDPPVIPSQGIIDALDSAIRYIENPPRVSEIMIRDVYSAKLEDALRPAMQIMADKAYTHIPILNDNGRVSGVFSENTLLSGILDDDVAIIDKDATFSDLSKFLPIDKHASEVFDFIRRDALVSDAKQKFDDALQNNNRLGMLFVTHSGEESEGLLGILTAWDVAAVDPTL